MIIWQRLLEAVQDQDDDRRRKAQPKPGDPDCVAGTEVGTWRLILDENLPSNTISVSRDVFESLRQAQDTYPRFNP